MNPNTNPRQSHPKRRIGRAVARAVPDGAPPPPFDRLLDEAGVGCVICE